jgi:hypothetical protein
VIPSVQAITGSDPNAAIRGCQHGLNSVIRQTLIRRKPGDGQVAKAVEPACAANPNIAFTVFEDRVNVAAGETIGLTKHIRSFLMHMHQAAAQSSNPQTTLAITEHPLSLQPLEGTGKRIRHLQFPRNESSNSARHAEQKGAVIRLSHTLKAVRNSG